MEPLERCASLCRRWPLSDGVRRAAWLGLLGIALCGSLVKEFCPLPESYFSNKRNLLNVYFVKLSWGWTLVLLLFFVGLSTYVVTRSVLTTLRRISSLLVGTIIWHACTSLFIYIENATGSCFVSEMERENKTEHTDKRACIRSGGFWEGFDISGHSFLLPYCVLMILEEAAILQDERVRKHGMKPLIELLAVLLTVLASIWAWMFCCTAVYFHTPVQKLFGTFFGVLAWYATYRWWYLKSFSPGLPPRASQKRVHRKAK
ncbi:acyl-coenzyme A diphosphatase FITM2 [Hyperolius riggenbachi]|uniref:acyl-coenzyme A diphosphatase FITM2 n=1 Tax=Hyperolius riggenbachi TaxID=752182 RepID=UPI0035A33543